LITSLTAVVGLAAVQVLSGRLLEHGRPRSERGRRWVVSAAAGVSVACAFIDILPELGAQHLSYLAAAGKDELLFAEQRIYILALVSFVLMFGLDRFVLASRTGPERPDGERGPNVAFVWHLAGFGLYSALIGYLLRERAERGPWGLAAYVVAMAVHVLIVAHTLEEEHGARQHRVGRWVLAACLLAGWVAAGTSPVGEIGFARLFAFLAGGVVITSVQAELAGPGPRGFAPFALGAMSYAMLLLLA
jgi:hypothetical protein